jgi:hypothetical protein
MGARRCRHASVFVVGPPPGSSSAALHRLLAADRHPFRCHRGSVLRGGSIARRDTAARRGAAADRHGAAACKHRNERRPRRPTRWNHWARATQSGDIVVRPAPAVRADRVALSHAVLAATAAPRRPRRAMAAGHDILLDKTSRRSQSADDRNAFRTRPGIRSTVCSVEQHLRPWQWAKDL